MPLTDGRLPLALGLGLTLLLAGCGGKHGLEGSLTELLSLSYSDSSILFTDAATSVRFTNPQGEGENTVLNVSVAVADLQIVAHGDIDLTEQVESGGQRGVITRNVLNDPHRSFPTLSRGNLRFESVPVPGTTVLGTFSVTFKECTDFACGRTVYGDFTAKVPKE
jgi:hypothetical protein